MAPFFDPNASFYFTQIIYTSTGTRKVGGERRVRNTSFLLVLTILILETLSSTGRARISLKHGLGDTKSRRSRLAASYVILTHFPAPL